MANSEFKTANHEAMVEAQRAATLLDRITRARTEAKRRSLLAEAQQALRTSLLLASKLEGRLNASED